MTNEKIDINEFDAIDNTGMPVAKEQVAPEDEIFHSIYIAGKLRKHDDLGITEMPGLLQIRGFEYNKETVCMIITHVKAILAKVEYPNGQQKIICSSFLNTDPWIGSSGRKCGVNRAERDNDPYCQACRQQIIIAGILCDETGKLYKKDKSSVYGFIRGKGYKYSAVADYINMFQKIEPDTIGALTDTSNPAHLEFEKKNITHKRFVTGILPDFVKTERGDVSVFKFEKLAQIPDAKIKDIMNMAKEKMAEFEDKFNWAKNAKSKPRQTQTQTFAPSDAEKIPDPKTVITPDQSTSAKQDFSNFDFGDVSFEN